MFLNKYLVGLLVFVMLAAGCRQSADTLFAALPSSQTGIEFVNKPDQRKIFGILYYLYYYNGGGVATGDINGDGLPDVYFTANSKGGNKLYLNKGNFSFEDITAKAGVMGTSDWCTGATMADVNGDGHLDIYVSAVAGAHGLQGKNELFINKGNGTFTESAAQYGLGFSGFSTQAAFFDFDHDGDLDCYLLNQSHKPNQNVVDTSNRRKADPMAGDRLLRNDGSRFTDVSAVAGIYQSNLGYGLGLAIADINNDGWEDIYVGNDFHENDYYYINQGNGTFAESGAKHFAHYSRFSMGNDVADYNNDGHLDLFTVDMLPGDEKVLKTYGSDENPDIYRFKLMQNGYQHQYSRNCLQRNNGNGGSFSDVALLGGVSATDWSWCPLFADFDNDGNKDLFITSGIVKRPVDLDYVRYISDLYKKVSMDRTDKYDEEAVDQMPDGASHPFLYRNDGQMQFSDRSADWGLSGMKGYFNGAAYADLDGDGSMDLLVNQLDGPAVVLQNKAPKKSWAAFALRGDGANTGGIGSKVWVFAGGKMQYQQLMATRGFQSASDTRLHFGLGDAAKIDSVLVVWPDQRFQVLRNVAVNKAVQVTQKDASGKFDHQARWAPPAELLQPAEGLVSWKHAENEFVDFNVQYLIPHAQSTRGPKLAVADVNGDGLDDVYACGARGQAGTLMLGQAGGGYAPSGNTAFDADAESEDVDALFADFNGDGFADLVVASGGNEYPEGDPHLADRIYLNDGKGRFAKAGGLPFMGSNKSCIAAADVDKDGDQDLFVGVLANSLAYGVPMNSYLLINDGKGNFAVDAKRIALTGVGMVTAAQFADIDKNGYPDLLVAGEWMPLTLFQNSGGNFTKKEIPSSTGWWQTIMADDVDGDGNLDFLAGNWGRNNKFWSGKNGPVKLYVADFDRNGRTDQLLSYTINGKEYPFLAKDETERALPVLKKHYIKYAEYAGEEMKDVFYGFVDNMKPLQAEQLASVVCYGDGKGGFTMQPLPNELQLAPVFSFQRLNGMKAAANTYIAGGNFFDVIPYEGRYDGQPLAAFQAVGKEVHYMHQPSLFGLKGQVRDIRWLRRKDGQVLAVARNNEPLVFYKMK